MIGTLVFDEVLCDIKRIELHDSEIVFWATSRAWFTGSVDTDADATIFGADGSVIAHIPSVARGNHPNRIRDGYLHVRLPIDINHIDTRTTADNERISLP